MLFVHIFSNVKHGLSNVILKSNFVGETNNLNRMVLAHFKRDLPCVRNIHGQSCWIFFCIMSELDLSFEDTEEADAEEERSPFQ